MSNWVKKVADFHRAFLHTVPELHRGLDYLDTQDGLTNIKLRKSLITEEYTELMSGLTQAEAQTYCSLPITQEAKEEILDAITDLIYVTIGTAIDFGYDLEGAFEEVQRSNMSKLGEDGKPIFRKDGKILKGPNYKKPDLSSFV